MKTNGVVNWFLKIKYYIGKTFFFAIFNKEGQKRIGLTDGTEQKYEILCSFNSINEGKE